MSFAEATETTAGKTIITIYGHLVFSTNTLQDLQSLHPYTHEQADRRMFLHATRDHQRGLTRSIIKVTDPDVVDIGIATASVFDDAELWVAFGHGDHFRYIPAHQITHSFGPTCYCCYCMPSLAVTLYLLSLE